MIRVYHQKSLFIPTRPSLEGFKFNPESLVLVAEVDTDDLQEAFSLTNTKERFWTQNAKVKPFVEKNARSTSVGDVMLDSAETWWIVDIIGFQKLPAN